jgi:hypothetical protein
VLGAAVKASAAAFAPVLVLGAQPRRRAIAGAVAAGVAVLALVQIHYGGRLPDVQGQSSISTAWSLPTMFGYLSGLGGVTRSVRLAAEGILAISVVVGCVAVLRGASRVEVAGWLAVVSIATLPWVMPWYVLWVLPFAALSATRRLRIAAIVVTLFLGLTWLPQWGGVADSIGYHPGSTALGKINRERVDHLLH